MERSCTNLALLIVFASPGLLAEERPIPDDCEVLEGWVTVWIDQVRQAREEIINLKMEGQELSRKFDSELSRKFEYVTYESERFSEETL